MRTIHDSGLCMETDLLTGKSIDRIKGQHPGKLQAAAISSMAARGCYVTSQGELVYFDLPSIHPRIISYQIYGAGPMFLSDAPVRIFIGQKTSQICSINPEDGNRRMLPINGPLVTAAFSAETIATGSLFWELCLFTYTADRPIISRQIDYNPVQSIIFARLDNRQFLFVGSGQVGGGRIRLYRAPRYSDIEYEVKPDCAEIIHLNQSGKTLLAVSRDGLVTLWKIMPGTKDAPADR